MYYYYNPVLIALIVLNLDQQNIIFGGKEYLNH